VIFKFTDRPRVVCRKCDIARSGCVIYTEHFAYRPAAMSFLRQFTRSFAPVGNRKFDVAAEALIHPLLDTQSKCLWNAKALGENYLSPRSGDNLAERLRKFFCIMCVHAALSARGMKSSGAETSPFVFSAMRRRTSKLGLIAPGGSLAPLAHGGVGIMPPRRRARQRAA